MKNSNDDNNSAHKEENARDCYIMYSTQTGRSKACARHAHSILSESISSTTNGTKYNIVANATFDKVFHYTQRFHTQQKQQQAEEEENQRNNNKNIIWILCVSTTGEGQQCDSINDTWKWMLQSNHRNPLLNHVSFALYCLGDRAYGPQHFCAAGRKLGARLVQLGARPLPFCDIGYGDSASAADGLLQHFDAWIMKQLLPALKLSLAETTTTTTVPPLPLDSHCISFLNHSEKTNNMTDDNDEQSSSSWEPFLPFFAQSCPVTAYPHGHQENNKNEDNEQHQDPRRLVTPLVSKVLVNRRITHESWEQDTRHITLEFNTTTPTNTFVPKSDQQTNKNNANHEPPFYRAGDICTIMPFNSSQSVNRFLSLLSSAIQKVADVMLDIQSNKNKNNGNHDYLLSNHTLWPHRCTLRQWLTYCADLNGLPERQDLKCLSAYCNNKNNNDGREEEETEKYIEQRDKLLFLSQPAGSDLYVDYIVREKRSWVDVLYDFDTLQNSLTLEALFGLLPPLRPRHFSIASSLNYNNYQNQGATTNITLDLCVAVVKQKTPLGKRVHYGLCSSFLARIKVGDSICCWIKPGSFYQTLPLEPNTSSTNGTNNNNPQYKVPIMCIGAGTGIAPLRSILLERQARRARSTKSNQSDSDELHDALLIFGCRKKTMDFYYQDDWNRLLDTKRLLMWTAFSRDNPRQQQRRYVQHVLQEQQSVVLMHILEQNGVIYIAGGAKMAQAVTDELQDLLVQFLGGGQDDATRQVKLLWKRLQQAKRVCVEAWN